MGELKAKAFSREQAAEYEAMTARLSPAARGVWMTIRMQMCLAGTYLLEDTEEQMGWLLRCPSETFLTTLEEFRLRTTCGLRVEKPPPTGPPYNECTSSVRLVYEPDEKVALLSSSESLRLSKYREDKKKKEKKPMPENWNLSERMKEFGLKNGMSTATVQHEFQKCRTYHLENEQTALGWEFRVFQTWVLNWVSYGRVQVVSASVSNGTVKPPPFPGKHDPIARNSWRQAYGDPRSYGYE